MIYFDACYLGKLYLSEPDTPQVRAAAAIAGAVACSIHGQLEVMAIFHRKLREAGITPAAFQATCRQLELDCSNGVWKWIPFDSKTLDLAKTLFRSCLRELFFGPRTRTTWRVPQRAASKACILRTNT
jgi:hypothetical protein